MKKLLILLITACTLTAITGCEKEKPYSYYQIAVKEGSLMGGEELTYNVLSSYLVENNFIFVNNNGVIIEGDNSDVNDAAAVNVFQERLATLKSKMPELEQAMLNAPGTPCKISFNYELYSGRGLNVMDGEIITVICRNNKDQ